MPTRSPIPDAWNLPQAIRSRVRESVGRQRAMSADGHLLLVLHEAPRPNEPERRARFFWRSPHGAWQSNNLGPGIAALKRHLGEFADAIAKLDAAEERAEMADDYFALLRAVTPLHRAVRHLHDTLQEARQMVGEDDELIVCRDLAYQIYRSADLLHSDIQSGLECAVARRAEEQARSSYKMAVASHRLNVLAAIFFPLATVASIFGMNLPSGLEGRPGLFWLVLGAGALCGIFLTAAVVGRPERPSGRDPKRKP